MKVFLLGNGFDLSHNFPTRYIDFLRIVKFLQTSYSKDMDSVGKVLGNDEIKGKDRFLSTCYENNKNEYDATLLDKQKVELLIAESKQNIWFRYFDRFFSENLTWIDFEAEIASTVDAFRSYFEMYKTNGEKVISQKNNYIVKAFDIFFAPTQPIANERIIEVRTSDKELKAKFRKEDPIGSSNYVLDEKKIVSELYSALKDFSELLKLYLICFVELPAKEISKHRHISNHSTLEADIVFTFNYTNTYETLWPPISCKVAHVHGSIDDSIVIGINPDKYDELENMDTLFAQFKKYYQRVLKQTDSTYLRILKNIRIRKNTEKEAVSICVIGHSLDVTDKDIIETVFDVATDIQIFYHDESAIGDYIKNLVKIFGKTAFDQLRVSKNLQFIPYCINWKH